MNITMYAGTDNGDAHEIGMRHGLEGDALSMFMHAGEQHKMEYEVDPKTGAAKLIKVDGRELK